MDTLKGEDSKGRNRNFTGDMSNTPQRKGFINLIDDAQKNLDPSGDFSLAIMRP